jgi:hypothetical protein
LTIAGARQQAGAGRRGMWRGAMTGIVDFDLWIEWIRSVDTAWLFLLILAVVVVAFGLWSKGFTSRDPADSQRE